MEEVCSLAARPLRPLRNCKSAELAVLATPPIDRGMAYAGIVKRLTLHARAHAGNRFAPFERDVLIAVVASIGPFARGDEAPGKLDSILNAVIDLILDRSVAAPSACHGSSS